MAVHHAPTVTLPRQAGPVDPPLGPLPDRAAVRTPVRPVPALQTTVEREFLRGLIAMWLVLEIFFVGGLLLAQRLP